MAPLRSSSIINKLILKETEDYYTRYQINTENWDKDTRSIIEKGLKLVSL
jgi:hypothetical protein